MRCTPVHVANVDTCSYTCTRIQVYAYEGLQFYSVRLFSIGRMSEYSTCESKVQQVILARGIQLCEYVRVTLDASLARARAVGLCCRQGASLDAS